MELIATQFSLMSWQEAQVTSRTQWMCEVLCLALRSARHQVAVIQNQSLWNSSALGIEAGWNIEAVGILRKGYTPHLKIGSSQQRTAGILH